MSYVKMFFSLKNKINVSSLQTSTLRDNKLHLKTTLSILKIGVFPPWSVRIIQFSYVGFNQNPQMMLIHVETKKCVALFQVILIYRYSTFGTLSWIPTAFASSTFKLWLAEQAAQLQSVGLLHLEQTAPHTEVLCPPPRLE